MLSKEDNIRFTEVGPGSALNPMAKRQWLPYLRAETLEANGRPRKVELLGETYISFRAADGTLGFFDEQCPHRGASLVLGRSGDNALTCIFHGWKFDVGGQCIETPSEANPGFCKTVKLKAYPTREAGGVCWVYLGEGDAPVFPDYEFFSAPPDYRRARVGYCESNWTQNLETLLDSSHIGLLHASGAAPKGSLNVKQINGINTPRLSVVETSYGLQAFALRDRGDGTTSLRVTEFVAPFTVLNGATREEEGRLLYMVPINNTRTAFWRMEWDLNHPQDYWVQRARDRGMEDLFFENPDDFLADVFDRSKENFGQDREAMAQGHWSGFKHLRAEDAAVSDSVPIVDRTHEHLGASDLVIAKMRQLYFRGLAAFENGGPAPGLGPHGDGRDVPYADMRGTAEIISSDVDPRDYHDRVLKHARIAARQAFLATRQGGDQA